MSLLLTILMLFGFQGSKKNIMIKETKVKLQKYQGVSPPNPKIPKILPKPGKNCMLVWPGFQSFKKKKESRLFFLFTKKTALKYSKVTVKRTHHLRLIMENCTAWSKNAWRDIITHYFLTPVEKVSFYERAKKRGMIIDIEFKKTIAMPAMSHTNFMGYYLLLLEWGKKSK